MTETSTIEKINESIFSSDEYCDREMALYSWRLELLRTDARLSAQPAEKKELPPGFLNYFKNDELLSQFAYYYAAKAGAAHCMQALIELHPDMDLESPLPGNDVNAKGETVSLAAPTSAVAEPAPEAAATPTPVVEPLDSAPLPTGTSSPATTATGDGPGRFGSIRDGARKAAGLGGISGAQSTASPNPVDPKVLDPKKSR